MVSLLGGCHAAESIVGTVFVVVDVELPGGIADIFESGEQVLVKNLLAAGAVERLDVSVLVRLARLDVLDSHAVRFGPLHEGLTEEFGAVIRAQHLREWPLLSDTLEDAHQRTDMIEVSISIWTISRLKSSVTLKVRNERPQASASSMKSADHTLSGCSGTYNGTRSRLGTHRVAARRRLRFMAQYTR